MAARPQPMVVTHEGGLTFATDVRGHRILTDQPRPAGEDSAPTPLEVLGSSLGACVALYVQQFCETRGLPYEGFTVEVGLAGAGGRIGRFDIRVHMPEPIPEAYADMLDRVARSCPAHNTLVHGAEVDVHVETPAPTP